MVYKYPYNNIKNGAIVLPQNTQTAFLFIERQPLFSSSSRFVVESSNIPLLNKYANLGTGGETSYPAEVWFVDKSKERSMPWGMSTTVDDSKTQADAVEVKSFGTSMLKVSDPERLLTKLVATLHSFSRTDIDNKFRSYIQSAATSTLAKMITVDKTSIVQMQTLLNDHETKEQDRLWGRVWGSVWASEWEGLWAI